MILSFILTFILSLVACWLSIEKRACIVPSIYVRIKIYRKLSRWTKAWTVFLKHNRLREVIKVKKKKRKCGKFHTRGRDFHTIFKMCKMFVEWSNSILNTSLNKDYKNCNYQVYLSLYLLLDEGIQQSQIFPSPHHVSCGQPPYMSRVSV